MASDVRSSTGDFTTSPEISQIFGEVDALSRLRLAAPTLRVACCSFVLVGEGICRKVQFGRVLTMLLGHTVIIPTAGNGPLVDLHSARFFSCTRARSLRLVAATNSLPFQGIILLA